MTWTQHQILQGSSKYYSSLSSIAPANVSLSEPHQNGSTPHPKTMWSESTVLLLSIKKMLNSCAVYMFTSVVCLVFQQREHQIKAVNLQPWDCRTWWMEQGSCHCKYPTCNRLFTPMGKKLNIFRCFLPENIWIGPGRAKFCSPLADGAINLPLFLSLGTGPRLPLKSSRNQCQFLNSQSSEPDRAQPGG